MVQAALLWLVLIEVFGQLPLSIVFSLQTGILISVCGSMINTHRKLTPD
ncbi:hypothetical protein VCHE16_2031 [Vibrio paracholerae HE-16]|nr:hypothetical protein VCHE16_2031 [Vibrio paracholerae HE-16]